MKYLKMLGLAAVAAAALMAFVGAGTASATQLTCTEPAGVESPCPKGTVIHAQAEEPVTLHPPIGEITCNKSTVEGDVEDAGSSTTTVKGANDVLTFEECNAAITVLNKGSLEIHTKGTSETDGTLTSKGTRVTVVFGGFHCIFETNAANGTDIGTLTGSTTTAAAKKVETETATLDIEATIPRVGGNSGIFCGSTAQWTGAYIVNSPDWLDVH